MILLMSESKRYLSYFEQQLGDKLMPCVEETPYGQVKIAKSDRIIFAENMGLCPMGIAWIAEKYKVSCMGMTSKVGGINKLLNVGDVLIITDYIDNTTCRPKSYVEKEKTGIKIRYAMGEPFCKKWGEKVFDELKWKRKEDKINIFDSGIYVCTDGPGFESKSEINAFRDWGADVVGHWISPFVYYARELDICFVSIAVVSNVFHRDSIDMLNNEKNNELFGELFKLLLDTMPKSECDCQKKNMLQYEKYLKDQ